ncbi:MAG TPA: hypothetical protein VJK50_01625 [Patescibacteria group bacterium]|nr:hypothetical protein [Patescibacteria group bacterium]
MLRNRKNLNRAMMVFAIVFIVAMIIFTVMPLITANSGALF